MIDIYLIFLFLIKKIFWENSLNFYLTIGKENLKKKKWNINLLIQLIISSACFLFFLLYFAVSWVFRCWWNYLILVIMLNLMRQFDLADATCGSFFNNDVFVWAWCCLSWLLMSFDDLDDDIVIDKPPWNYFKKFWSPSHLWSKFYGMYQFRAIITQISIHFIF